MIDFIKKSKLAIPHSKDDIFPKVISKHLFKKSDHRLKPHRKPGLLAIEEDQECMDVFDIIFQLLHQLFNIHLFLVPVP